MEQQPEKIQFQEFLLDGLFKEIKKRLSQKPQIKVNFSNRPFLFFRYYNNSKSFNRIKLAVGPNKAKYSKFHNTWIYDWDGDKLDISLSVLGLHQTKTQLQINNKNLIQKSVDWILTNCSKRKTKKKNRKKKR